MRELTGHRVNPVNDKLHVLALDAPGAGGAHHDYSISMPQDDPGPALQEIGHIRFQNGPIAEVGVNGVTHEALTAIIIDRLECFQRGPFACDENAEALDHYRAAQQALLSRTRKRMERGVEGTSAV